MKLVSFATFVASFACGAASLHAVAVNFTGGPTDTANGFINIPITATPETTGALLYQNINGLGYDIAFSFSNNSALSIDTAPVTNGPNFESVLAMLATNSFLEVRFFETGTSQPLAMHGVQFRLEDIEAQNGTNEALTSFTYIDQNGDIKNPLFDDKIFTPDSNPNINLNQPGGDPSVFFHDGLDSAFQQNRGLSVDFGIKPVQGFRIERNTDGSGITGVSLGLGEPVPIPFDNNPLLGVLAIAGYLGWRVRRKQKAAATAESLPA